MNFSNFSSFDRVTITDATLRVRDLARQTSFYRDILGLRVVRADAHEVALSADGAAPALVVLVADPTAPVRPVDTTGLFHLAFLLPNRVALAALVRRLAYRGVRWDGASDHGVSEAFYLSDPEGNGIELYADRPAAEWPRAGEDVAMVTRHLDLPTFLDLAATASLSASLPPTTRLGHVHLSVTDLAAAEWLFATTLGLAVRQRDYHGALFFGADGYHHHVAANVWGGRARPPRRSLGLMRFTLRYAAGAPAADGTAPLVASDIEVRFAGANVSLVPVAQLEAAKPTSEAAVIAA